MSYPATIDAPGTTMQGTTFFTGDDHSLEHRTIGSAVVNIETFLGTNAANNGIFNSYTAGQAPLPINAGTLGTIIAKGTLNNGILGSPTITNGTINNATFGTPNILNGTIGTVQMTGGTLGTAFIVGGTANNQTLGTPTVQGAVINTANVSANAITNTGGTNAIGLSQAITTVDNTTTPLTGGTVTLVTTGNPCYVQASISAKKNDTSGYIITYLQLDGTQVMYNYSSPGQADKFNSISLTYFSTPASGTHNWVLAGAVSAGTMTINTFGISVMEIKR